MPRAVRQLVEEVESSGPLGTSAVIGIYGRALELLALESMARSGSELAGQAVALIDYFLVTRGGFTVAVANNFTSLRNQLEELREAVCGEEVVNRALLDFSHRLESGRQERLRTIAAAGAAQLAGTRSLLLYDYSSTVFEVVTALAKSDENLKLVVPESRTCDGGVPIIRQGRDLGCKLQLIPDVTLAFAMPKCDAVLVGVESFYSDGSFTNTVGSLTTAIVANHFSVPLYAVTDLNKADQEGDRGEQPMRSFSKSLAGISDLAGDASLETTYPPLEKVPGHLVTGYITERGVVVPAGIWSVSFSGCDGVGV